MENEGEVSQVCHECGENIPIKQVRRHMNRRHDKREFQCETCGITVVGYERHQTHKVCELFSIQPKKVGVRHFNVFDPLKVSSSGLGPRSNLDFSSFLVKPRSRSSF